MGPIDILQIRPRMMFLVNFSQRCKNNLNFICLYRCHYWWSITFKRRIGWIYLLTLVWISQICNFLSTSEPPLIFRNMVHGFSASRLSIACKSMFSLATAVHEDGMSCIWSISDACSATESDIAALQMINEASSFVQLHLQFNITLLGTVNEESIYV